MVNPITEIYKIARRLAAVFAHTATPEEEAEHRAWIDESPENKQLADRILNKDRYEAYSRRRKDFSSQEAWNRVSPQLGTAEPKRYFFSRDKYMKYAALVLLLLVSVSVLTCLWMGGNRIADIAPGTQGGELTLSDGSVYDIGYLAVPERAARTFVVKDGELNYQVPTNKPQVKEILNTLHTRQGMECSVTLSDGTRVRLNAGSRLTYPVCFSRANRIVTLEGEAYFDVASDASHPFIVQMPHALVQVTGTSFNIRAYADEAKESVTLVSGGVKVLRDGKEFLLSPDQNYTFYKDGQTDDVADVDARLYASWASGSFSFLNVPLEEVMSYLAKWYGFEYRFEDDGARNVRIGAHLDRYASMNPIIDMIRELNLVDVRQRGGTLHISSKE